MQIAQQVNTTMTKDPPNNQDVYVDEVDEADYEQELAERGSLMANHNEANHVTVC